MKITKPIVLFLFFSPFATAQIAWVRVNQLGYLPDDVKAAVFVSKTPASVVTFSLYDALTDKETERYSTVEAFGAYGAFQSTFRLDFSALRREGAYYIKAGDVVSPVFRIAPDVYEGMADFLLHYMRAQRCGYNPLLMDSCHTAGGYILYHPDEKKNNTPIDVWGGWHDASDYLQYGATSANAIYQMLFAFTQRPAAFSDRYDANGGPKANGVPDILDEAKWGLDWALRMNPAKNEMYAQVADDRDHRGMRMPDRDTFTYDAGHGLARPVYFANGKPQGLFKYKNQTKGAASLAGKYAAAFALGAQTLKKYYPSYADSLIAKAKDAYEYGLQYPGATQTAPCRAPYYYAEENDSDDMELAAVQLYELTRQAPYLAQAKAFGQKEPFTSWMGADTARHYQWYPFVNLGHYLLARAGDSSFRNDLREGLNRLQAKGKKNVFGFGVPFIWCSNNLVAAALTQSVLYRQVAGDTLFATTEAALRDWLFGCNPWGTSMIIGTPLHGVAPRDPHSAFTHLGGRQIEGGLIDGPIYGSIYNRLIGIKLYHPDAFAAFQSDKAVYHDDYGDYSTNEPTMDGTASLSFYLASLEGAAASKRLKEKTGAVTRLDTAQKIIYLVFTGHEFADGEKTILRALKKTDVKASFFLTGDFYRKFPREVRRIRQGKHYLGGHSDKHLLYCSWEKRDSLYITQTQFMDDLRANYAALAAAGIKRAAAPYFLPPYEWYNKAVSVWCKEAGVALINNTPGTFSNADYTTPGMKNYKDSETIYRHILEFEKKDPAGLNGVILLCHIGVDSLRADKFYNKLEKLVKELKKRGYAFDRF